MEDRIKNILRKLISEQELCEIISELEFCGECNSDDSKLTKEEAELLLYFLYG